MSCRMFLSKIAVILGLGLGSVLPGAGHAVQVTAFKQAVAEQASDDPHIAAFYRARGFDPIWTRDTPADLARRVALIDALRRAPYHGLPAAQYDADRVLAQMAAAQSGAARGALEVGLTRLYLDLARDLQTGIIDDPAAVRAEIVRDIPLRDVDTYMEGLLSDAPAAFITALAPQSQEYLRLMKTKMQLEQVMQRGGWGARVPTRKYQLGDSGGGVVTLRNRLMAMGYLAPTVTAQYDAAMREAVEAFQLAHGLESDGVVGRSTLDEINVSVEARLASVIVAMERERWINRPGGLGSRHILVNLVDFTARIYDEGKLTFQTRSVVGHQDRDRQTPEFSDEMDHMVINPSWYVPRSIIVKEYLPQLRSNPNAVSHLVLTDNRGRVVGRDRSFAEYSARSFPYAMRQPPGPGNALGSVKFMFPNKHNIYLHDTPAKNLFSREVRTYSHGCVRLKDPHEFAYALLAPQTEDPVGFFQSRLRSGAETRVTLEQPVPVHLIYRTAFTTAKGGVQFRRDVYGRDRDIWAALRAAGVEIGAIRG